MKRRHPVALAAAPLLVAGAALAFFGVRSLSVERTEADREALDWARKWVATASDLAPQVAESAIDLGAAETLRVDSPLPAFDAIPDSIPGDERLLLDEAAYLERARGDHAGALALLKRLADPKAPSAVRYIAALRGGTIARRIGDPAARPLLYLASEAPVTLAETTGLPVWLLARRQRVPLEGTAGKSFSLDLTLLATENGTRLHDDGSIDAGDVVIAIDEECRRTAVVLEPDFGAALARAAEAAARGHAILAALGHGTIASGGTWVARRKSDTVSVATLAAFGDELVRRTGGRMGVGLSDATLGPPAGAAASRRLAPPLDSILAYARATPAAGTGRGGWFLAAALLVYALGGALSVIAIRRSVNAARMQADFVAAVSHEMKTPIAGVMAMAEMLADGRVPDARGRQYALRMQAEMQRLGATVKNVLDAARIERQAGPLVARRAIDPAGVVEDVAEVVRPVLESRGFRFDVETQPAAGPMPVDPDALASVLTNLLDNAAKFSGDARELSVIAGPAGKSGRGYRVRVSDRGPGVPAADREHVFERFWRGDAARVGAVPGVGLGLHVARELVLAHGGTISVEDRAGGGADFVVELPEVPS